MKVAICTNFVSPYRAPVFDAIAQLTGAEVRVFVNTDMEADRGWDSCTTKDRSYTTHRSFSLRRTRTLNTRGSGSFSQSLERHYPIALPYDLIRFKPDVIISGELGPRTVLSLAAGACTRTHVIPWTYHASAQTSGFGSSIAYRKHILSRASAVVGMGTQARSVLESLGCDPSKVFDAPNAADSDTIEQRLCSREHRENVDRIRRLTGGKRIALVAGRLVEMKGIEETLRAWESLSPEHHEAWALVFVGDGPLRCRVETSSAPNVLVTGHKPPHELPDWYAASDLHIFSSLGDPWGLVVNEAMQCSTPTLCSVHAGCSDDLIDRHSTGFLFDPTASMTDVARAIHDACETPSLQRVGAAARQYVKNFTPETMARGFVNAINASTHNRFDIPTSFRKESA